MFNHKYRGVLKWCGLTENMSEEILAKRIYVSEVGGTKGRGNQERIGSINLRILLSYCVLNLQEGEKHSWKRVNWSNVEYRGNILSVGWCWALEETNKRCGAWQLIGGSGFVHLTWQLDIIRANEVFLWLFCAQSCRVGNGELVWKMKILLSKYD